MSTDVNRPLHSRPWCINVWSIQPFARLSPLSSRFDDLVATQSGYLVGKAITGILAGSPLPSHHPPASRGPAEYPAVYLVGPRRYLLATL
jgi:hypothetical protein